jgi:hypothetical protein
MAVTQIFVASTLYGLLNVVAGIESGLFDQSRDGEPASEDGCRRVLVTTDNGPIPEIGDGLDRMAGFEPLSKRFDQVESWNAAIRPFHPSDWKPRKSDLPLWERYVRGLWNLGDDRLELIVESIQVAPAQTIARILADARIDVYADGLMSYGPTRFQLDPLIGTRVERLLYPDLVPGLSPLLLSEFGVSRTVIPPAAVTRLIEEISEPLDLTRVAPPDAGPVALLLGQYLSALDILTPGEEERLHLQMLIGAIERGHTRVIFKPHPTAPRELADSLRVESRRRGIDFTVLDDPVLAESWYDRLPVAAVVGCFSTAMITATRYFGIPAYRVGTELMLERLSPYHNSNRVPVTIVDAIVPAVDDHVADLPVASMINELIATVGHVMQPGILPERRATAEAFLSRHYPEASQYFKRRRLSVLGLPGALEPAFGRRSAYRSARRRVSNAVRSWSPDRFTELRRRLPKPRARR